jgi:hypothetical protein
MFQLFLNRYSGIPRLESRLTAAAKAGYDTVYLPAAAYPAAAVKNGPPVLGQRLLKHIYGRIVLPRQARERQTQ